MSPLDPDVGQDSRSPTGGGLNVTISQVGGGNTVNINGSGIPGKIQESPMAKQPHTSPLPAPTLSRKDRLGICTILFFTVGTALLLAAWGCLCFFWFGNDTNTLWRKVTAGDWLIKAVTICAEVIKQAISFQIGAAIAMAAAIALETFNVLYQHAASLTMMRATASSGTVWILLWHQIVGVYSARTKKSLSLLLLVFLLTSVYCLAQVISVLLISDIGPGSITGASRPVNTTFGFNYNSTDLQTISQAVTWTRVASIYPTFAEYFEPPYVADGVSDTGLTLRAFLPFKDLQDRETLQEYVGSSTVIDARVSCQVPYLTGGMVSLNGTNDRVIVDGALTPTRYTPRLANATYSSNYSSTTPFSCAAPLLSDDGSQWPLSFCQLQTEPTGDKFLPITVSGGLISEFLNMSTWLDLELQGNPNVYGSAYLVLNLTLGSESQWFEALNGFSGDRFSPPAYSERGEWLDLVFSNGELILSATLCYTAFDQADLPINISSGANRTEFVPSFNYSASRYSFTPLREQFGQYSTWSVADRGVLAMQNQSWLTSADEMAGGDSEPYLRRYASFATGQPGAGTNISGIMVTGGLDGDYVLTPDIMHVWLVQEILQNGGSVAFALQSMITLLSSMTYYDNLGNFDKSGEVQLTFFTASNIILSSRGFVTVTAAIAVHFVLVAVVLYLFLARTKFSRLGATWAALAHGANGETRKYLETADASGDGDIKKQMGKNNDTDVLIGIRAVEGRIGVYVKGKTL